MLTSYVDNVMYNVKGEAHDHNIITYYHILLQKLLLKDKQEVQSKLCAVHKNHEMLLFATYKE